MVVAFGRTAPFVIIVLLVINVGLLTYHIIVGERGDPEGGSGKGVGITPSPMIGTQPSSPAKTTSPTPEQATGQPILATSDVLTASPPTPEATKAKLMLPRAMTATPVFLNVEKTVSDQDISAYANDYIRTHSITITEPSVMFIGDRLEFNGLAETRRFVVPLIGQVEAIANPTIEREELRFDVTSLTFAGQAMTGEDYAYYSATLETVLHEFFGHELVGLSVKSAEITEGAINIKAVQKR